MRLFRKGYLNRTQCTSPRTPLCPGTQVKVQIMLFEKAQQLESTGEVDDGDLLELQV
jgi:hypothetical protein